MRYNRLNRGACALLLFLLVLPPPAVARAEFRPTVNQTIAIMAPSSDQAAVHLTEARFIDKVGASPWDRIGLHRLLPAGAKADPARPVLLFLPGTNMNGELPLEDPNYWMPLFLALHGVDVWSFDYRTHFVPADTPPAGLAPLADWNSALFVADVSRAAAFVIHETGSPRLFVGGFSRGAEFAYLFAAQHPGQVRGLVILDGYLFRHLPGGNASAKGTRRYADDISGGKLTWSRRQALLEAVIHDPNGPSPLPQFQTAARNLEHVVYSAGGLFGGHGGLSNPYGGFSDPVVLARVLLVYDRYWPAVQDTEDPLTPRLRESLAASKLPVIAFASTNIAPQWPLRVRESASSTGGVVSVIVLPGWGHLDVLCGTQAHARVYAPVLALVRPRAGSAGTGRGRNRS